MHLCKVEFESEKTTLKWICFAAVLDVLKAISITIASIKLPIWITRNNMISWLVKLGNRLSLNIYNLRHFF